jgi:hypothetical protein
MAYLMQQADAKCSTAWGYGWPRLSKRSLKVASFFLALVYSPPLLENGKIGFAL